MAVVFKFFDRRKAATWVRFHERLPTGIGPKFTFERSQADSSNFVNSCDSRSVQDLRYLAQIFRIWTIFN